MTRSPLLVVSTCMTVLGSCSATRGEILGLKPPVPTPIMMRPTRKQAKAPLEFVDRRDGIAEQVRMMCPTMAMASEAAMVL